MKNKNAAMLAVFVLVPFLMAMSSLQSQSPEKIPVPGKKYSATFIDQTDYITECSEVSIEGETFLEGKRGNGTNAIPFDNIKEVSFIFEKEQLKGDIKLRDGNTINLMLNKNQRAYGRTKYGTFQIKLSELKKMILIKSP